MGWQKNTCAWGLEKHLWYVYTTCNFVLPFCVVVGRQSHHASLIKAKGVLKKGNIRSPNDAWRGYLKTWDRWNSQSFQWQCQKWGLQCLIWISSCNGLTVGLWPRAIKLNLSWKMEVSKSASIKPCHHMIALQKLWKMSFISSKKLILFLRYSFFCIFVFPSFPACQSLL